MLFILLSWEEESSPARPESETDRCVTDLDEATFPTVLGPHLFLDKNVGVVLGDYGLLLKGMK